MRLVGGIIVALCGCNQVFGLDDTRLIDASVTHHDAPIDVLATCPPIGTVPRFSTGLNQVVTQNCSSYSVSTTTGLAVATCYDASQWWPQVSEGQPDGSLLPARGFPDPTQVSMTSVRLTPEGDQLYVDAYDYTLWTHAFRTYQRLADGSWQRGADLPFTATGSTFLGGPTRGPTRHLLVTTAGGPPSVDEYVSDGSGGWNLQLHVQPADLGLSNLYTAQLSGDGLRMIAYAERVGDTAYQVLYADRPSPTVPFGLMAPLGVPLVSELFMTEDCGRLYFPALSSIFYTRQID